MTIIEFLEARLAEDEERARKDPKVWIAGRIFDYLGGCHWESVDAFLDSANWISEELRREMIGKMEADPERALREIAAKRALLEWIPEDVQYPFASVYSDHEDFQKEWGG